MRKNPMPSPSKLFQRIPKWILTDLIGGLAFIATAFALLLLFLTSGCDCDGLPGEGRPGPWSQAPSSVKTENAAPTTPTPHDCDVAETLNDTGRKDMLLLMAEMNADVLNYPGHKVYFGVLNEEGNRCRLTIQRTPMVKSPFNDCDAMCTRLKNNERAMEIVRFLAKQLVDSDNPTGQYIALVGKPDGTGDCALVSEMGDLHR